MSTNSCRIYQARARNRRIKEFVEHANTLFSFFSFVESPKRIYEQLDQAQTAIEIQQIELDYLRKHEPSSEELSEIYNEYVSLVAFKKKIYHDTKQKFGK